MTLPPDLPADFTTGSPFTAPDENLDETTINAIKAVVAELQSSELQRVSIVVTTSITLSAGTTVTLTSGSTIALPANADVTMYIESGGLPTLPTAVGNANCYRCINASGSLATVAAAVSGQTICGSTLPLTLPVNASIDLSSDNANYWGA